MPASIARPFLLAATLATWPTAAWSQNASSPARTASAGGPRVSVESGILQGVDSAGVQLFAGIPYASPPVGDLRWRAPRPVARWRGVRPAAALAHNCMQARVWSDIDAFAAGVSEDCLYLNVWTARADAREKRPVMVWIHGGGFLAGFGGEARHDGAPLARKGAVVVSLNYRLGALGFLAHPALAEGPGRPSGNYGLLDQIAALEWVRRNIARFGGDPSRVTIFGQSAGGASVGALMASPRAKGLFQRAILQSGTGLGGAAPAEAALAEGAQFAERLGIRVDQQAGLARALRMVPADTIVAVAQRPTPSGPLRFRPIVDGVVIPRPLDSAIVAGTANLVPVMVGSTSGEGAGVGASSRSLARLMAQRGQRAYLYQFTRAGEDSASRRRGAAHSDEIVFVFGRPTPILPEVGRAPYDSALAESMSDYWLAFAASGDPNGAPGAGRRPRWPAYDRATEPSMEFGPALQVRTRLQAAVHDSLDAVARAQGQIRP